MSYGQSRESRPAEHGIVAGSGRDGTWAIVLAAGAGARFGGRKQFAELAGVRLVDRAVATVAPLCAGVVLVVPDGRGTGGPVDARVVAGGSTRPRSVRAGLAAVPASATIVLVHDAAHPLASRSLAEKVLAAVAAGADAAVPGLPVTEAVRRVSAGRAVEDVPRADLVLVQMPQAFRTEVLRRAHAREPDAVEDSELVADLGGVVRVVAGEPANIHVTTRVELLMAERLARPS